MSRPIKCSLGESYLIGVVENTVRPFVGRSRVAKLLGSSQLRLKHEFSYRRSQSMLRFSYLDRRIEQQASRVNNFSQLSKRTDQPVQTKQPGYIKSKPETKPAVLEQDLPQSRLEGMPEESGDKASSMQELDLESVQQQERALSSLHSNVDQSLSRVHDKRSPNVETVEELLKTTKRMGGKKSGHKTGGNAESAQATEVRFDKSITPSKKDFIGHLGKLLESNNFSGGETSLKQTESQPLEQSVDQLKSEKNPLPQQEDAIQYKNHPITGDSKSIHQKLDILRNEFSRRYQKNNPLQKENNVEQKSIDEHFNMSFAQLKGPMKRKQEELVTESVNTNKESGVIPSHLRSAPRVDNRKIENTQKKSSDMPEEKPRQSAVNQKTIVVEREVKQSVFSDLPDAFWERNYLGHAGLRLYK